MPKVTKTSPDPPSILQKLANIYNWRENLAENVNPYGYSAVGHSSKRNLLGSPELRRLYNAIVLDQKEEKMDQWFSDDKPVYSERQDLLNMLLGREQKHNTIKKSEYKPTKAKDSDVEYYKSNVTEEEIKKYLQSDPQVRWNEKTQQYDHEGPEWLIENKPYGNVLGHYIIDKGVDEKGHYVSYYDKWDVHPFSDELRSEAEISRDLENKIQSAVGLNPAEIYGRVYYDPKTGKPIESKKDGGRIRKYQDGGDVNDLLKMLNAFGSADPKDKELLSSLVSESTQPSGYTTPVLSEDNKIDLIHKPAQITQGPDEVEKVDWSTMFANPMQMLKYTSKYGITRPTKAELDAQGSNIYDSITSMFNPSAYVEALKHMDTSLDAADQALLQGFKDGRLSPGDLSNIVGNLSDAGMQALFLSMAPMGGRTWASAIKELRRPALGARIPQEFRGSRLLGPTAETATTESSALQQLAGTQKALPAGEVHVRYGKETLEGMLKPLNLDDFTVLFDGKKVPKNMTWFGPANRSGKYNVPGTNRFEATLDVRNPLVVNMPEVWTVERIQDIISQGYDAIVVTDGAKVTETIPLDKSIINVIDKSKPLQQLAGKKPLSNPQTNQPIVFYHGTSKSAGDKILAEGFTGQTSLMNRRDYAQNYATSGPRTSGDKVGTVIESHVTLNNPMNFQQSMDLREKIIGEIVGKSPEQLASPGFGMTTAEWQKYTAQINREFIKRAKELGYDGVYDVNQPEIIVFDPSSIKVVGSSSVGKAPKVKKKKYEPVSAYEESNVATSSFTNNPGVYQYPSFMTGSKLEKQVSPKDGTIARSALEQLVKNKNTKHSEAIAVKDVLSEFEGKRIPYENFKQSLALDIRSAEIFTTDKHADVGLERLGYKVGIPNVRTGKLEGGVTPKTNLYKDPALPTSDKHFSDLGIRGKNTFWIRSFVSEDIYHVLEMQTDIASLKGQKHIGSIPKSKELDILFKDDLSLVVPKYVTRAIRGSMTLGEQKVFIQQEIRDIKSGNSERFEIEALQNKIDRALPIINNPDQLIGRIDPGQTVDQVIQSMKEGVKKLKAEIKGVPKKMEDQLALYEKALDMIPDIIKNSPYLAKLKSDAKSLPLKYVNEALLDAARGGQTKMRIPTSETVSTIEGWSEIDTQRLTEEQLRKLKETRMSVTKNYRNFPKLWKNEFGTEVRSLTDKYGNTWYEVDVPEKFFQTNPSNPVEIKTYRKGGKALTSLVKKYGAGGSVSGWGAQGNFTTEYVSKQPDVEELEDPSLIPELNALAAQQESGGEPLTPEEEKKLKGKKALQGAGKGAMAGASFGPWGAVIGGVVGGAIGYFAKKGTKIKKSLYDNGGLFKALRERRADRRIEKTPVRDASSQEVLEMLSSYGADSPMMQGEYDPIEKEIVMYKDDPDTLKHEQVHAAQYGPLQRLAYRMNQDRSAPIQDPTKRKVYRKLSENISPEAYAAFNRAGKLILDKGEEFEAVLDTGVNAAKEKGVNFNASFEEILSQLKNVPSPTNNMIGLMKFMENRFTKEQRDLILKSIR